MKFTPLIAVFVLGLLALGSAQAQTETVFYSNTYPAVFTTAPVYFTTGGSEWADDTPFSGSHLVSSFTMGYIASEPVRAVFRFYGVDPATGKPGQLFNEFSRDLPAGENTQIVTLSSAEQFVFTAEPGLNLTTKTGGWFSIRFESLLGTNLPTTLRLRLATGSSATGLYNVTTGQTVSTLDPDGLLPSSFYLEMRSTQSEGIVNPVPATLQLMPSTVVGGADVIGTVILESAAPAGGVEVSLSSSSSNVAAPASSKLLIGAGNDRGSFTVNTSPNVPRKGKTVEISATANGGTASAQLTVTK